MSLSISREIPPRIYLEPGAPYSMIATQLAADTGMRLTQDREDAGLVLLEEETAQRVIRTRGWAFHPLARVVYIPGMLFVEDKCKLAHLLSGAPYHPQTAVDSATPEQIAQSRRWIEKRGLGANGQDVRIVEATSLLSGGGWAREGYVLQKYEDDVLLYEGRKFDMRVHAIMLADGRFAVHRDALVRRCARPYSAADSDPASQITNMSVQKRFDPTLASVTSTLADLPASMRALLLPRVLACVADLLERFRKQTVRAAGGEDVLGGGSALKDRLAFRMFGIDILPLADGQVRVLEVNYRPAINLTGSVAPFYRRLIRWMGGVLLKGDSPELTLPADLCEPVDLARLHPLAFRHIQENSPRFRLISAPRLDVEIARAAADPEAGVGPTLFVNRERALARGREVVVDASLMVLLPPSGAIPGWIAVDVFSRSQTPRMVVEPTRISRGVVWFGVWRRVVGGKARFSPSPARLSILESSEIVRALHLLLPA